MANDERADQSGKLGTDQSSRIFFVPAGEEKKGLALMGLALSPAYPGSEKDATRFESRAGYDYLTVHLPDFDDLGRRYFRIECYLDGQKLLLVGSNPLLDLLEKDLETGGKAEDAAWVLISLFNQLLEDEKGLLARLEDEIQQLEDQALTKKVEDHTDELVTLRKELLVLKRYYEGLYDLFAEMEEGGNHDFSKDQVKVLRAQKNKANRLLNKVMDLRDQLALVREAFQNQLDISLNDTMRFFTVITAIFLPLTLLVGWYGMNLSMPELESSLTYPIIIGISVVFIFISLAYCKKKGWF